MCKALQRALHSACSVISSNFGCAFLEYQMFKYRGITLAYLFVPFCISFTFKIFQTLHYFIFPFATRKLHYKRHILNFVILLWSDRYLVSVLISQKTPHAAISLLSTTHLLLYMILRYKNKLLNCHPERCWGDQVWRYARGSHAHNYQTKLTWAVLLCGMQTTDCSSPGSERGPAPDTMRTRKTSRRTSRRSPSWSTGAASGTLVIGSKELD